jgi:hypothetical protein
MLELNRELAALKKRVAQSEARTAQLETEMFFASVCPGGGGQCVIL